jgi:phospholipase C
VCTEDMAPGWNEVHLDVDGGLMDGFAVQTENAIPSGIDSGGRRTMGYYDWNDIPYYYELAFQYGTSDRWFSSVLARTIPNRMYLFAGTSFGHINNDSSPGGGWSNTTIFDRLDAAGITWRIYLVDETNSLADWSTYSRDSGKVFPLSQYFTDIQKESTTPQVIFIDRGGASAGSDEHPGSNIQTGAAQVARIMNGFLASPVYQDSTFFLSWDEPGGLYDHVPPVNMPAPDGIKPMLGSGDQPGTFMQSGLRVPVIVVSPWTKPHFVSHVNRDHTSILKFIETRFNLSPLTSRDNTADAMMEFFDFSNPQMATPPSLPSQPTNGLCDAGQEVF